MDQRVPGEHQRPDRPRRWRAGSPIALARNDAISSRRTGRSGQKWSLAGGLQPRVIPAAASRAASLSKSPPSSSVKRFPGGASAGRGPSTATPPSRHATPGVSGSTVAETSDRDARLGESVDVVLEDRVVVVGERIGVGPGQRQRPCEEGRQLAADHRAMRAVQVLPRLSAPAGEAIGGDRLDHRLVHVAVVVPERAAGRQFLPTGGTGRGEGEHRRERGQDDHRRTEGCLERRSCRRAPRSPAASPRDDPAARPRCRVRRPAPVEPHGRSWSPAPRLNTRTRPTPTTPPR